MAEMSHDELLDTIQRLIALSSSSNENESAMALARAEKLMAEHNISMADLETQKVRANYGEQDVYCRGRASLKDPFLCGILQDFFFVRAIYIPQGKGKGRKTTLRFFGDKINVEIASYVYDVLDMLFDVFAEANKIPAKSRRSYYQGLCHGFKQKLREERESLNKNDKNRNALVLVDKALVEAFQKQFPNTTETKRSAMHGDMNAYNKGLQDGKDINLRKGVKGKENPKLWW